MAKKITEETRIKREIKDWLRYSGFFMFPILQGLGAFKGIPDIIAIKYGKTLYIEVKTLKGRLSEHQKVFRDNILDHGGIYIVATSYRDIEQHM